MEVVSVKFQEKILKKIDNAIKDNNFNSRTEFIRESVRDKLKTLKKMNPDELLKEFLKLRGTASKKTTYEQDRKTREQVSKELLTELEKKFNI